MTFSEKTILSVKALNDFVKRIVDGNSYLSSVNIKGEISNFTNHYKSGHLYFSIKDEEAQVKCVMFSSYAAKLSFLPENGMKVVAHGRASVFVRDGQYIFYVDKLEEDGIGDLYRQFEEIKNRLNAEGLFDASTKKAIPRYPSSIGIITSDTGAAIQDIKNIISRRYPLAEMILYPSLVQGQGAVEDLCRGVEYFARMRNVDTVIIGRGGGSIEDLWAFNSEKLARVIFACPIPVISAVGHETDFTICDFTADLRAPTPSAAAELAVPDSNDLRRQLNNVILKMKNQLDSRIDLYRLVLERNAKNRFLQNPENLINEKRIITDALNDKLNRSIEKIVDGLDVQINNIKSSLSTEIRLKYEAKYREYATLTAKLEMLNPMAVISRGYSAVFDDNNKLIKSVDDVEVGDNFNIRLTDGEIAATTTSKRRIDNV